MLKSIISSCILFFIVVIAHGQKDSVQLSVSQPEYDFVYKELFNFSANSLFGELDLAQPISPSLNLNMKKALIIDFNMFDSFKSISLANSLPVLNPYVNSFAVTNQAHYKLSDKLIVGGNSFSANSIFNPIPLNSSIKDMSIRGASMYLEYKISDKFRVGGSIGVSNQGNRFLP